jgi:hypothetical protein
MAHKSELYSRVTTQHSDFPGERVPQPDLLPRGSYFAHSSPLLHAVAVHCGHREDIPCMHGICPLHGCHQYSLESLILPVLSAETKNDGLAYAFLHFNAACKGGGYHKVIQCRAHSSN